VEAVVDRADFIDDLRQTRVLSDSQLRRAESLGADTAAALAAALVAEGLLTPFQAQRLRSGEGRRLNLGQYRLLEELGRGGMGSVYKAVHTIMGRVVAVKVVLPELVDNPLALDWFRREVRAATQLVHPNIVMAYDANEADGVHFLVMEYVDGTNLDSLVRKQGPLPLPRACALLRQAALALQHAHEKGMVHRDVKPANMLVPREGSAGAPLVKLVDFGLARLHKQAAGGTIAVQTASGLMGTPDYIAPEQCRDIHSADIRSDLYGLGGTLYFVLTGRVPFDGETPMEKLVKHLTEEPVPVEERRRDVPPAVAGIVRRLMAKKPEHRYQTPAELAEALAPWCEPKPAAGPRGGPPHLPPMDEPDTAVEGPSTCRPDLIATGFLPRVQVFTHEDAERAQTAPPWDRPDSREPADQPADDSAVTAVAAAPPSPPCDPDGQTEVLGAGTATTAAAPEARIDPALRIGWRRWSAVVEAMAERKAPGLSHAEYRALYAGLLEACRAHAAASEGPWRAFFVQAEEVVKPWLELHTLAHTEPELLRALARRCAEVAWELNGRRAPRNVARWAGVLLLAACVALFLLPWRLPRVALPASGGAGWTKAASSYARTYWQHLEAHPTGWAFVAVPVVIGLSIFLITRSPRM
jgi:serine/threonine-protein kinase